MVSTRHRSAGYAAFVQAKGRYGARRIQAALIALGRRLNRKAIAASLRCQGLRAKAVKDFKATANSRHTMPVAPNDLQQQFTTKKANVVWFADITYVATR